jgi:opacity protein-like surface antigen
VSPSSVYGTGAYTPPVYNPFYYTPGTGSPQPAYPLYNTPVAPPPPAYSLFNAPVTPPPPPAYSSLYNAPWDGGGLYVGATGSASFMRDSDLIKRFEPRTTDSLVSISRSTTSSSTPWQLGSGTRDTSNWVSTSTPWRLNPEGGSKTKVLTSSTGYDVGARAGYQFDNFRTEFQFDYANNSVDTFGNGDRSFSTDFVMRDRSASGSTTSKTFLINGFIDVKVPYLGAFGVTPYFGGGIGGGQTSLDLKVGDRTIVNGSEWGLAYDLGAGVRWQVMPNLSLDLGYRYRAITDVTLHSEFERITVPYRSHNFEVSALWNLTPFWGAAAPATPYVPPYIPPPPPPARPALPTM